jgi:hypothetical protein
MKAFLEQWLNGLAYELFFPGELNVRKLRLFEETEKLDLPDLVKMPEKQKLIRLQEVFSKAYDRDATVRGMLFDLKSLEIVRVIEDRSTPAEAKNAESEE